jgi:dCMP deaminase
MSDRQSWDDYFLGIAQQVATRSTCLATPVGAVLVQSRQIIATGYNGPPTGADHCTDLGFCYPGVDICSDSPLPSRAIHAEANAIGQAAMAGVSTKGATLYITMRPCLSCLKVIIASGIARIVYANAPDIHPPDIYWELAKSVVIGHRLTCLKGGRAGGAE